MASSSHHAASREAAARRIIARHLGPAAAAAVDAIQPDSLVDPGNLSESESFRAYKSLLLASVSSSDSPVSGFRASFSAHTTPQPAPAIEKLKTASAPKLRRPNTDSAADLSKLQQYLNNLNLQISAHSPRTASVANVESPFYDRLVRESKDRENLIDKMRNEAALAPKDPFPKLTDEADRMASIVNEALNPRNRNSTIVSGFNVDLQPADIRTLSPGTWLNDEIINFYGQMIMERSKRSQKYPKIHYFNTFFYTTLLEHGYDRVRRWTKKFDLFALDLVIIPVHLGVHWCLSVIDFRNKRIEYFDAMKGNNPRLFALYREYLNAESLDKRKKPMDFSAWTDYCPKDIPGQLNGYDCGVFACMYAEYRSRDAAFDFSQKNMGYLRRRMVYEICTKTLHVVE
ncbi:SUMO1 sentrin specific peptidase 1 [Entophlyctis luteolus]|nr:SUMO1 sentrin specific peptidase 1 [Entophlyctis luteolus]